VKKTLGRRINGGLQGEGYRVGIGGKRVRRDMKQCKEAEVEYQPLYGKRKK